MWNLSKTLNFCLAEPCYIYKFLILIILSYRLVLLCRIIFVILSVAKYPHKTRRMDYWKRTLWIFRLFAKGSKWQKWRFTRNDSPYTMHFLNFAQTRLYKVLCWLLTFNFVSIAWVFFRAENLQGVLNLLKTMFGVVWIQLPQKWHRMPETLAQINGRNDTIFTF